MKTEKIAESYLNGGTLSVFETRQLANDFIASIAVLNIVKKGLAELNISFGPEYSLINEYLNRVESA